MPKDDSSEASAEELKNKDQLAEKLKKAQLEAASRDAGNTAQDEELSEVEQLKKQLAEMTEMAKRAMADLQNLKRRVEEQRSETIIMANAHLLSELLPILDNLDRASEHVPKGAEEWFKGLKMSISQLHQVFTNTGLAPMETVGQPFNPDLHEAVAQGPGEKDTVVEEFEKGYKLGDRVIRHAKVKVGSGSPSA